MSAAALAIPNCALTREAIVPADVEASVQDAAAGAVVSFIGTTRNEHLGRRVLYLEYEAHEALALKTMTALCGEAREKFGLLKVALRHRLGRLEIGEASVVIAVSAAHRGAAFDGCRFVIDKLKTSVPIWKKEIYADGSTPAWVGPDGQPVKIS